jgi:HAD superfamily hydrolase (TIGR01509 family)
MSSKSLIRTVLLDGDGVIQLQAPSFTSDIAALCGSALQTEAVVREVFEAERPALVGQGDFRQNLRQVLRRWGSGASVDEALRLWQNIQPNPEALALVEQIRPTGRTAALASNQQAQRAAYMRDVLGYGALFDELLFSCELGFAKPDGQYFAAALQKLSVQLGETLFVDDHLPNVLAARSCGINAEAFHLREGVERPRSTLLDWGALTGRS